MGKVHIKLFCQQYTVHNTRTLKEKMKSLEEDILRQSSHDDSADSIERNTFLWRHVGGARKNSPLKDQIFSAKRNGCSLCIFLWSWKKPTKTEVLSQAEFIPRWCDNWSSGNPYSCSCLSWGPLLCWTMWWSSSNKFVWWLPHLSEEDQQTLDNPISFAELSLAVQELNPGKSPGLDGLSAEFYRVFWNLIGEDLAVFLESFNQGKLPLSCRRAVLTLIPKKGDLGFLKNWRPCHWSVLILKFCLNNN